MTPHAMILKPANTRRIAVHVCDSWFSKSYPTKWTIGEQLLTGLQNAT